MKQILSITYILLCALVSLNSLIHPTHCTRTLLSYDESTSPEHAPAPEDGAKSPAPSVAMQMQDSDGDDSVDHEYDLPFNFNPLDSSSSSSSQQQLQLPKAVEPDVKKTCDATDNPDLCIWSLKPFLTKMNINEAKTDTFSLLKMQIKAALQATQHASELSGSMNIGLSDDDMDSLRDCKEMYDDAVDNLNKALEGLSDNENENDVDVDVGSVNSMLSAVISDIGTCNDGFTESGSSSPMADYTDKLSKLVSNCLATAQLIKH